VRLLELHIEVTSSPQQRRDKITAFHHALPELIKLNQCEQRALSRRRRAIRTLCSHFNPQCGKSSRCGEHTEFQ
jgi:hypothetical protein